MESPIGALLNVVAMDARLLGLSESDANDEDIVYGTLQVVLDTLPPPVAGKKYPAKIKEHGCCWFLIRASELYKAVLTRPGW